MKLELGLYGHILGLASLMVVGRAADTIGTIDLTVTNGTKTVSLPLVSGVDEFKVLTTTNLNSPFGEAVGTISGYTWTQPGEKGLEFFKVQMTPKDSNTVVAATLLNRLAYGPTPDEVERLAQIGPQAYINEQLAPEKIQEDLAIDRVNARTDWQQLTVTGVATSSEIFIYMNGPGDCYIDDIQLVKGSVAGNGTNAVQNGDFENGFTGWTIATNLTNSVIATDSKYSGTSSLHVFSTSAGDINAAEATSIFRKDLGLAQNQTYTLSYWYHPGSSKKAFPTVRLANINNSPVPIQRSPASLATLLSWGTGALKDLTAWHVLHAVQSKKQLLEVLLQFLDNHFVTEQSKSMDYVDRYYGNSTDDDRFATSLESFELNRWRQALLNPQCTFYDLLKISAESPAMIIYLDTVGSKGNGANIANENYARELQELFTFGVDNGYDQNDITVMSRVWTGWTIGLVDASNQFNPFAPQTTNLLVGATNPPPGKASPIKDLDGVWAFNYKPQNHNTSEKIIFPGKTVPARFGSPYAGRNYELKIPAGGGGTNWQYVSETGIALPPGSPLYIYVASISGVTGSGVGDCYVDDIKIVPGSVAEDGVNMVKNGDFESGLNGWTVSANLSGSKVVNDVTHSGNAALHVVSASAGSTQASAIWRGDLGLTTNETYTLSYWYRPGSINGNLTVRLSGASATSNGINVSPGAPTNSIQEGYTAIAHLADQPFTQEFLSVKLCRLFVHDDFAIGYDFTDPNLSAEGQLVRACMRAWEENVPKGQIRKVLEVIFNSDLFRSQGASAQKVKTPFEFTVSAVRALRAQASDGSMTADSDGYSMSSPMNRMGRMILFNRDTPDGYPEAAAPWVSAGTVMERLRYVQALLLPAGVTGKTDAGVNSSDPVKLLKMKVPQASWHDANAVANYFVGILYPGEGKANLDQYRSEAVRYLNTADDGVTPSAFSALVDTTTNYDYRVRGMVATLMTFQRFQEQ